MSGLAAFSRHDNIRPIALEGSRWGFGVAHDKVPAESKLSSSSASPTVLSGSRCSNGSTAPPSPGCTDPPRAGIFINFYHVLSLLQNT